MIQRRKCIRMGTSSLLKQLEVYVIESQALSYRLAYSYVKNENDALDIVQESICKAFSKVETSLKNPEHMKTWFYRIVVNTSLDFLRKQSKIRPVDHETIEAYDDGREDVYEDLDLKQAMELLPEMYQTIIILRFYEDLKIEEIALITNENLNTVKTRLYKALKLLKLEIKEA